MRNRLEQVETLNVRSGKSVYRLPWVANCYKASCFLNTFQEQTPLRCVQILTLINEYPIKLKHVQILYHRQVNHISEINNACFGLAPTYALNRLFNFIVQKNE